jgi:predicted Zn-dependent protease
MQKLITNLLFAAVVVLTGCSTVQTTQSGAVGVERKQFMMLSEKQVENMAAKSYLQTLKEAEAKKVLNTDSAQVKRVRAISNRLIAQTGAFRPDALNWKWEVNVEENEQLNAYCMPGGKIMVYTGLMEKLNTTDDELAAVIGHEISHALREHGRERMSIAYAQQAGVVGVAVLAAVLSNDSKTTQNTMAAAAAVSTVALTLPNSREQEREADRVGLELAARAGYDPNAAVSLWKKMMANGGGKPPEWLSTHPSEKSRIQDIEAMVPRVMPLYQEAKAKRG